ncbi:MAG: hypothetical protein JKY32_08830 [Rhizobiales bacterium]|nr:hypothetical protein [Hyphomicrobiales bacterium]
MDTHARYMFDAVFACSNNEQAASAEMPRHNDIDLEAARNAAYQQGLADGRNQSQNDASAHLQELMTRLLVQMQAANETMAQYQSKVEEKATKLALIAAQKLAQALISREPEGEMIALFSECIAQQENLPHLVIHVPPNSADTLKENLENLTANLGAKTEIRINTDETISEGDCRIVWTTGEISRNRQQLEEQINSIIERRFPTKAADNVAEQQMVPTHDAPDTDPQAGLANEGISS